MGEIIQFIGELIIVIGVVAFIIIGIAIGISS